MLDLFVKQLESINDTDVRALIGWPESLLVEFKKDIPSRGGRGDAWIAGGNVEQYGKERIFKEVVALGNTSGGHVILGVAESDDKPAVAERLAPIPRCVDLAERLERSAQTIDPPIPLLGVRGIPTEADGSGVVVFRVPESRNAPHRSIDKECYVRRGTESVPMTMRDIRDLISTLGSRSDLLAARFARSRLEFQQWFGDQSSTSGNPTPSAFRLTAVPVGGVLALPRLFQAVSDIPLQRHYAVTVRHTHLGGEFQHEATDFPVVEMPVLRGVRKSGQQGLTRLNLFSDGVVELFFRFVAPEDRPIVRLIPLIAWSANVLRTVDYLRIRAGAPDCEYAVELEVRDRRAIEGVQIPVYGFHPNAIDPIGRLNGPILLPQLSFGPIAELSKVVTGLVGDLFDATGGTYSTLPEIIIGPTVR